MNMTLRCTEKLWEMKKKNLMTHVKNHEVLEDEFKEISLKVE